MKIMKIIKFKFRIMNIIKTNRMAFQNHSNHENPELHAIVTTIIKIKKFKTIIMKIKKIVEFHVIIKKIMKILEIQ